MSNDRTDSTDSTRKHFLRRRSLLKAAGVGVTSAAVLTSKTAAASNGPYAERVKLGPFEARTLNVGSLTKSNPPTDPDLQGGQQGSAEARDIPHRTPAVDGQATGGKNGAVLSGNNDVLNVETDFDGLNTLDVVRRPSDPFFVIPGDPVVAASEDDIVTCVNNEIAFVAKENAPDGGTRVPDDTTVGDDEYLTIYRGEDWFGNVLKEDFGISDPALFENIILSDPRVRYDDANDRFIIAWITRSLVDGRAAYLLSVSASSDPRGTWYNYAIEPKDNNGLVDYPSLGYDADGIYLTQNFFSPGFEGATFDIVDKEAALAGENLDPVFEFTTLTDPGGGLAFTVQPADAPGESASYAVSSQFFQGQALSVWKVTERQDGTPELTNSPLRVPPYTNPIDGVHQRGTEDRIDMGDDRILDTTYDPSDGTLWAAHTVNDGSVRWYELDPSGPSVEQNQTFKRRGKKTFYPAVGTNGDSTLFVYNTSNGGKFANMEVAGRRDEVESGDLEDYAVVQEGETTYDYINGKGDQTSQVLRWGDYNAVSVDPTDDSYWVVTQYANKVAGRPTETEIYGTRIAKVTFD